MIHPTSFTSCLWICIGASPLRRSSFIVDLRQVQVLSLLSALRELSAVDAVICRAKSAVHALDIYKFGNCPGDKLNLHLTGFPGQIQSFYCLSFLHPELFKSTFFNIRFQSKISVSFLALFNLAGASTRIKTRKKNGVIACQDIPSLLVCKSKLLYLGLGQVLRKTNNIVIYL